MSRYLDVFHALFCLILQNYALQSSSQNALNAVSKTQNLLWVRAPQGRSFSTTTLKQLWDIIFESSGIARGGGAAQSELYLPNDLHITVALKI